MMVHDGSLYRGSKANSKRVSCSTKDTLFKSIPSRCCKEMQANQSSIRQCNGVDTIDTLFPQVYFSNVSDNFQLKVRPKAPLPNLLDGVESSS